MGKRERGNCKNGQNSRDRSQNAEIEFALLTNYIGIRMATNIY